MPMGMEHDALWVLDDGVETGMGGLAASLRDYARFGLLYLNEGRWNGQRILPEAWVRESVKPDSPHLQPGKNPKSDDELGYQYQWWTPRDTVEAFMALGIWGQSIYVNPGEGVVIVKLSADPTVFSTEVLYAQTEYFQALSKRISKLQP
jgi:CubicO group peptidase (beta-lactamase class C family)